MPNEVCSEYVELASGVYWVGTLCEQRGLDCNPYLIVDGDTGVLIDPGSIIDFEIVRTNVEAIIPLSRLKYIILHHQDPDLCSSTPLFEKAGFKGEIVTHWRTSLLIQYYGIAAPFYIVNERGFSLELSPKRTLKFIPAPYMHFPGAIMTYDPVEKILFSGDVFGAFSYKRALWAGDDYIDAMKIFHENYIPSNDIIRPVMEKLLTIPIDVIASQHGSIIKGRDKVVEHIKILRELECGAYLSSTKKELVTAGNYTGLCNQVLKRLYATYGQEEVAGIFSETRIVLDETAGMIIDYNSTGRQLWNDFFQFIYEKKSLKWFIVIDTLVHKLVADYEIDFPEAFKSALVSSQMRAEELDETNRNLMTEARKMKAQLAEISNQLMRCSITGLYNERFFIQFLQSKMQEEIAGFGIIVVEIDNILRINSLYDKKTGDEVVNGISYFILNEVQSQADSDNYLLAKLNAPSFALFVPLADRDRIVGAAERIKSNIQGADIFVEPVTVSIGIMYSGEYFAGTEYVNQSAMDLMKRVVTRTADAKRSGGNTICDTDSEFSGQKVLGKVVIIEPDDLIERMISESLQARGVQVYSARDGRSGLTLIETEIPDIIVTELNTPQMDGMSLKRSLFSSSRLTSIPFILLSSHKTETAIQQAISLNIRHFFSKPFSIEEIIGLITNILRSGA